MSSLSASIKDSGTQLLRDYWYIFDPFLKKIAIHALTSFSLILYTSWRRIGEYRKTHRKHLKKNADVGRFIGVDMGGTLTKIVYFVNDSPQQVGSSINKASTNDTRGSSDSSDNNSGDCFSRMSSIGSEESSPYSPYSSPHPPTHAPFQSSTPHNRIMQNLQNEEETKALQDLHKLMPKLDTDLTIHSKTYNGKIHFVTYETKRMDIAIANLKDNDIVNNLQTIGCTGGGASKYADSLKSELGITVNAVDEFVSLMKGMSSVLTELYDNEECFTYTRNDDADIDTKQFTKKETIHFDVSKNDVYPYIVVNIGSGVSFLKVKSPDEFERVHGSSLGGGTFLGLCKLFISDKTDYESVLKLASSKEALTQDIDLTVKDIYGGHLYKKDKTVIALSENTVASSFGKLPRMNNPRESENLNEAGLAKAALMMITNNIGQIAYLTAKLHNCKNIFFIGSFLRYNQISCHKLSFSLDFWSNHEMKALFLRHEGYMGALGTFLINTEQLLRDVQKPSSAATGSIRTGEEDTENSGISKHPSFPGFVKKQIIRFYNRARGSQPINKYRASTDVKASKLYDSKDNGEYASDNEISLQRPSNAIRKKELGLCTGEEQQEVLSGGGRQRTNTYDESLLKKVKESARVPPTGPASCTSPITGGAGGGAGVTGGSVQYPGCSRPSLKPQVDTDSSK